eukprot:758707-Hanusia_phi.AAC.7
MEILRESKRRAGKQQESRGKVYKLETRTEIRQPCRRRRAQGARLEAVGQAKLHRDRADVEGALPEDEGPVIGLHSTPPQLLVAERVAAIHGIPDDRTLLLGCQLRRGEKEEDLTLEGD